MTEIESTVKTIPFKVLRLVPGNSYVVYLNNYRIVGIDPTGFTQHVVIEKSISAAEVIRALWENMKLKDVKGSKPKSGSNRSQKIR